MAKGESVLQGMIDKLIETGRCYGTEMNVKKTKVMRISRQPSPVTIMIDQKQLENVHSFIHSIGMCRIQQFLAVLRSFFHSSLLCTFSCHPSPPTILPSSLTPSCHLFLGLPLNLVVPKFIYTTLLGILFSSIFCTCFKYLGSMLTNNVIVLVKLNPGLPWQKLHSTRRIFLPAHWT